MRLPILLLAALLLGSCSAGDQQKAHAEAERARENARRTGEEVKQESRAIARQAEAGAAKASREIDRGLEETRDHIRHALNQPSTSASDSAKPEDDHKRK